MWGNNFTYIDFDNDGVLDYFSFLVNSVTQPYAKNGGKYLLVKDLLGEKPKPQYTDCTTRWAPNFEINDVNNDGYNEIIQASSDGHGLADGTNGVESPLKIIYFNIDGTFNVKEVGEPIGIHDLSSGDIDNDVDIVTGKQIGRAHV